MAYSAMHVPIINLRIMDFSCLLKPVLIAVLFSVVHFYPAQTLFNKVFSYENSIGNLEKIEQPAGYLICSTVRHAGDIDGFQFTRFDSTGLVILTHAFETGSLLNVMQYGSKSLVRSDGSFSFLFGSRSSIDDKWSLRLFNTSSQGVINWNRSLEFMEPVYSLYFAGAMEQAFEETPDKGYLITGLVKQASSWATDTVYPMVTKLDSTGNVIWNKVYESGERCAWHIISRVLDSGEILIGYHADTPCSVVSGNNIISKISANRNTIWSKTLQGFYGRLTGSAIVDDGVVISAMDSSSIYIMHMDTAGVPVWGRRYILNFQPSTWSACVRVTSDGGYVLTASKPENGWSAGPLFIKVDESGVPVWQRRVDGDLTSDRLIDLIHHEDGYLSILMNYYHWPTGRYFNYMTKVSDDGMSGCLVEDDGIIGDEEFSFDLVDVTLGELEAQTVSQSLYVGYESVEQPILSDICLYQVGTSDILVLEEVIFFPNPTTGSVMVRIPEHLVRGSIVIYDIFGKHVYNSDLTSNALIIDLSFLSNGMYVYHMMSPAGSVISGKIIKE